MKKKWIVIIILAISFLCFLLGLYFPIMSSKSSLFSIVLDYKEINLFDSVRMFYIEGEYIMAFIIFMFTIVLPIVKYLDLFNRLLGWIHFSQKTSDWLKAIDKWSMIDVFLVALLLLNFKWSTSFVDMELKIGTTFIAISVLLRMIVSSINFTMKDIQPNN